MRIAKKLQRPSCSRDEVPKAECGEAPKAECGLKNLNRSCEDEAFEHHGAEEVESEATDVLGAQAEVRSNIGHANGEQHEAGGERGAQSETF
eukprot:15470462-Alexandrium_andersonii.AAC.1